MKINESQGIVTNENKWDALCKIISTYIYDIEDGLNADPFYVDDPNVDIPITLKNVNSYSKYKYHKSIDKIIPTWVGKAKIEYVEGNNKIQGAFIKSTAEINNGKLDFTIRLIDANIPDEKETYSVLVHEFRHAYTRFLELSKGISIISKKDQHIYSTILNRMRNKEYGKINLISTYYKDSVVIDESIYENCDRLYSAFLSSLYYANNNEVKSFLEQFNADMEEQFKDNKKEIEDAIRKTSSIKNYNSLSDIEQYNSRILNIMPVTPYDSSYFRRYKAYQILWENIDKIPDDITVDLFNRLKSVISIYLYNNILNVDILDDFNNAYNGFTGHNIVIKKKVKNKILPQLEKVVRKMNQIYANKILKIREGLNV